MFEHRNDKLLPRAAFLRRFMGFGAVALGLVAFSLLLGMAGYHWFEKLSWLDAFLNAAMLLGGMGPVDDIKTPAGKLFAGCYALYSGLVIITAAGVLAAPLVHRFLHRFHLEAENAEDDSG